MASELRAVVDELGGDAVLGRRLEREADLQPAIREGFPQKVIEELMEGADLSIKELRDDSRRLVTTGVGQRSEVLVFRHEYSRLRAGKSENGRVLGAWTDVYDCGDVMACRSEHSDHGEVTALVREKTHRLLFAIAAGLADENDFLVGERVGRVPHRRVNVLTREPRIGVEEISFRRTFSELAKQRMTTSTISSTEADEMCPGRR